MKFAIPLACAFLIVLVFLPGYASYAQKQPAQAPAAAQAAPPADAKTVNEVMSKMTVIEKKMDQILQKLIFMDQKLEKLMEKQGLVTETE